MQERLKKYYLKHHQFVNGVVLGAVVGATLATKYGKMPMPDVPHLYVPDQLVQALTNSKDEMIVFATPHGDLGLAALVAK